MMPARNLAHLPKAITSPRLSGMGDRAYARAAATFARLRLLRDGLDAAAGRGAADLSFETKKGRWMRP